MTKTVTGEFDSNTDAELEQYESPLSSMPTYEQMRQLQQQQAREQQQTPVADLFTDSPFIHGGDDDYKPRHQAKEEPRPAVIDLFTNSPFLNGDGSDDYQPRHQAKEPQTPVVEYFNTEPSPFLDNRTEEEIARDRQEKRMVSRQVLGKGEHSTVYKIEYSDGTVDPGKLESEYLDMSESFMKNHQELERDPDLKQELADLAQVVASLDATKNDCYNDGDSKKREEILESYTKLRERLKNPATSQEDKDLINEFFDRLGQTELDFLKNRYEEVNGVEPNSEGLEVDLEKLKDQVEASRKKLEDCIKLYDNITQEMVAVKNSHRIDFKLLWDLNNESVKALNSIDDALKSYGASNDTYINTVTQHRSQLDDERINRELDAYNEVKADIKKKLDALEDERAKANDLRQKLEDILR